MTQHKASIRITAEPEQVWSALVDTPAYPEWDPALERVEGRPANGQTLRVVPRQGKALSFTVTELHPTHKMIWRCSMMLGLITGERTVILTAPDSGVTKIVAKEEWGGPLHGLFGGSIPDPGFKQALAGLKQRLEG